ncbi:unnamed protein product [Urochloa humidicola]
MARDPIHGASWEETFQWQRPPRPDKPELRDVAVDPFSLQQFSPLDIDKPLPIPSVSVHDRRGHVSSSPARFHGGGVPVPAVRRSAKVSRRAHRVGRRTSAMY